MKLKKSTFSLLNVVDKIHALFTPIASTNRVSLHYHINQSLPNFINTDETRLIQVLSNLISNSLKFTNEGGSIDIGFELIEESNEVGIIRVDVRDSGIGISEEDQKSLFKSFEQLDNSTTKSYSGTGLGLAISKQLVTLLGGQIGLFSNPGLGSTFWFTFKASFPKADSQFEKKASSIEKNLNKEPINLEKKEVLVVDDNLINREVAGEILKTAGCSVKLAVSGEEAIALALKTQFDVILMDIQMPGMDGIQATKQIRELEFNTPPKIIAMTAYAMKEDRDRFLKLGMDDYLPKPIRANALLEIVFNHTTSSKVKNNDEPDVESLSILNTDVIAQLKKYGGEDILDPIFEEFNLETETQLEECKIAIDKEDWDAIRKLLHTIKGTSGTLGVEKMAKTALSLETLLKENKKSNFEENFSELINNFYEFKDIFKEIIGKY